MLCMLYVCTYVRMCIQHMHGRTCIQHAYVRTYITHPGTLENSIANIWLKLCIVVYLSSAVQVSLGTRPTKHDVTERGGSGSETKYK